MSDIGVTPKGSGDQGTQAPPPRETIFSRMRTVLVSAGVALLAGLVASLCATFVMGGLRLWWGIQTPMELFGEFVLLHIDVNMFIHLILSYSRVTLFSYAIYGMIALGTVLGLLYAALVRLKLPTRGYRPSRLEWLIAGIFTLVMTLAAIILFWVEIRQNLFGLPIDLSRLVASLGLLIDFAVYSAVLSLVYRALLPKYPRASMDAVVSQRRQLLTRGGVAALGLGAGLGTFGVIQTYLKQVTSYDGMKTFYDSHVSLPVITPNNEHYVVTQNIVDPHPAIDLWRLEVTGLVNKPGSYTYEELQKLPSTSRAITLECIANGIGDHLLGNAIWQGVSMKTLLEQHGGAQSTAKYVAFYSVDGYTVSQPLKEVLAADTLLAWRMNGADIPNRHGYPLRALIPGRYGEENAKWVTRIDLTNEFVDGLYSSQGWYNGPLHTISRIDRPGSANVIQTGQSVDVRGVAFAGNRGISKVELSLDGGSTWKDATLEAPTSPDSWVFWTSNWQPTAAGEYMLVSRATDGTGEVQTEKRQGTVPNGATGYHILKITVR